MPRPPVRPLRHGVRLATLCALLVAVPAVGAQPAAVPAVGAQPAAAPPPADAIPRDVVVALFGTGTAAGLDIRVGGADPDLPPALLAEGLVLGSVRQPRRSLTAVMLPADRSAALAAVERHAAAAGWTRPPQPAGAEPRPRGFQASRELGFSTGTPDGFCRGDRHLGVAATAWEGGGTLLRLALADPGMSGYGPCRQPDETALARATFTMQDTIIPLLRAPDDALVQPRGSGGGMGRFRTEATVVSRRGLAAVAAHYAAELREAGWEPAGEAGHAAVHAQLFRRTHPVTGRPWHATLTVATRPADAAGYAVLVSLESDQEL